MASVVENQSVALSGGWLQWIYRCRWGMLIAAWVAAFALTHYPTVQIGFGFSWEDKIVHGIGFAGLATLLTWAMTENGFIKWSRQLWVVPILLAYAIFDEATQPLAGRYCDFYDGIADFVGMTFTASFWSVAALFSGRWKP